MEHPGPIICEALKSNFATPEIKVVLTQEQWAVIEKIKEEGHLYMPIKELILSQQVAEKLIEAKKQAEAIA